MTAATLRYTTVTDLQSAKEVFEYLFVFSNKEVTFCQVAFKPLLMGQYT